MKETVFRTVALAFIASIGLLVCLGSGPTAHADGPRRCVMLGPLPDPVCTPGSVETTDRDRICTESTRARRHVAAAMHRAAFEEYGLPFPPERDAYEVDHKIPLELGGDNTLANLWPEAAAPYPGFHQKDRVEDYLHRQVCSGAMSVEEAQRAIATDWTAVYRQIEPDGGR